MIFVKKQLMDTDSSSSAGVRARKTTARKSQSVKAEPKPRTKRGKKSGTGEIPTVVGELETVGNEVSVGVVELDKAGSQGGADMSEANQTVRGQNLESEQDYGDESVSSADSERNDYYGEQYEEDSDYYAQSDSTIGQNQIVVTLSYSLMNQVRQTARMEGVLPEDIIVELVAEGVTRRAFEDAQRPAPSHLMTRTGYVAPDANGNVLQPQLSHHSMQGNNNRQNQNRRFNQNNNRGHHHQGRNRQNNHFKNKQRNGK